MQNADKIYMKIAEAVSEASYAQRSKVGAILVKDENIIAFGYNGTPAGFLNECEDYIEYEDNLITKPEVLHAESNAIAKCAKSVMSSESSTLYTTHSPCFQCAKLIIQAGITRVVYQFPYPDKTGLTLLQKASIITDAYEMV